MARQWAQHYTSVSSSIPCRHRRLAGTALATVYVGTLRLKLLKVGAVVLRNTRRIRLLFASHYPYQEWFLTVVARLCPG